MDNENPHAAFVAEISPRSAPFAARPAGRTPRPPKLPQTNLTGRRSPRPSLRSAPRSRVGLLRRWSVAELLVGAVSRRRPSAPPAEGSATRRRYQASVSVMRRPPAQLSATAAGGPE